MAQTKTLLVFDFDHSVVDGNTDIEVQNLNSFPLPDEIQSLYCHKDGWNEYMGAIFKLLHENGRTVSDIKERILSIPLIEGMKELFDHLNSESCEVIIVSDSNTLFIDWLLTEHGICQSVHRVYSNPAKFNEEGRLTLQYYHHQDWCKLSSKNMCKGHIVESHVKERQDQGVIFTRVCYVGDGNNDYCPTLRLSANDYVFPRENHALHRKVEANSTLVKATVVAWKTGSNILETLQQICSTF